MISCKRSLLPVLALALAIPAAARAQARPDSAAVSRTIWFPRTPLFRSPLAGPHTPRFAGAFVVTDILSNPSPIRPGLQVNAPAARELMAIVNLGGSYPGVRVGSGDRWLEVGLQVGMDTRFRMKLPQKDMYSADWMVALPVSVARGPWAARLRAIHRSSHMGDQFLQATGAHRIQMGNDGFDLFGARTLGPLRAYAGGEWIAYSEIDDEALAPGRTDHFLAQAGLDADWHAWSRRPEWSLTGGLDWQGAQRTAWRASLSAEAGVGFERGSRSARLVVRAFHGLSEVYQFFRTEETFYGLELVVRP
jgi:hypothetical protein